MLSQPKKPSCEAIISLFPEPFVVIDRNFHIVAANQKYRDHYQVGKTDIVGKHCYEVSHGFATPCSQQGEQCPLEQVLSTAKPTSVMHIHYNNRQEEHVQISASPIFNEAGDVAFMAESIHPLIEEAENEQILLGKSKAALRLMSLLYRVASTSSTVLLLGESGVGKDCAARYIHQNSTRSKQNFIVMDCGTLGESLIERELFGHEKGAFTGADRRKPGLIEAAHKGTLLIDEIGDLPIHLQTKLLRFLETGTIRRIGGNEYIEVDVRIIAATNRDLQVMLKQKTLREDLYYRLSAFPVTLPPLRERKGDIPLLAEASLKQFDEGDAQIPLSPSVIEKLLSYDYPGNIRQLKNIIERALILAAGTPIQADFIVLDDENIIDVTADSTESVANELTARVPVTTDPTTQHAGSSRLTREQVLDAITKCNGHRSQAAKLLGVSERTIYRHLKSE